jgi:hypothetical protein
MRCLCPLSAVPLRLKLALVLLCCLLSTRPLYLAYPLMSCAVPSYLAVPSRDRHALSLHIYQHARRGSKVVRIDIGIRSSEPRVLVVRVRCPLISCAVPSHLARR